MLNVVPSTSASRQRFYIRHIRINRKLQITNRLDVIKGRTQTCSFFIPSVQRFGRSRARPLFTTNLNVIHYILGKNFALRVACKLWFCFMLIASKRKI